MVDSFSATLAAFSALSFSMVDSFSATLAAFSALSFSMVDSFSSTVFLRPEFSFSRLSLTSWKFSALALESAITSLRRLSRVDAFFWSFSSSPLPVFTFVLSLSTSERSDCVQ